MAETVKFNDKEFDISEISEIAKKNLIALQFADSKIMDLKNVRALLQRSKSGYLEDLKKEVISSKAGFLFENDL